MALVPYVAPLLLAAILSLALVALAASHRAVPGIRWFVAFMSALAAWTVAYAAEILVPGLASKIVAAKAQYLGISFLGISWLAFTTEYTGLLWWSRRRVAGGLAIPAATLLLVWTNGAHDLVWSSVTLSTDRPYTVLLLGHGPWFWVQVAYSYLCLLLALASLARVAITRPRPFRGQSVLLLLGSLPPWIGNALYVTGLVDTDLDLTVFGFALTGLLAGAAVLRWRLLSIGPIARETIVDGMPEPVAVVDAEARVVDANPAALRVLGLPVEKVVGWPAASVLAPFAPDPAIGAASRRALPAPLGGRRYDREQAPVVDAGGRFRGFTLVLHDVTEREAEADALRRARAAAEELAAAQRVFLDNMNHEMRTPLHGVMGLLELLQQGDLDDAQRGYARKAYECSEELLSLVDRLAELSAVEMGRFELAKEPFDLPGLVKDAVAGVEKAALRKGLALRLDVARDAPGHVVGDARRLGRALDGLLDNAVKFTDRGGVDVRLSVAGRTAHAVKVRVDVADTGIGIPRDRVQAVFEGFVQADPSPTRRHQGAGLGLTLTERLVSRMGGRLQVETEVNRGSRFWFEVPLGLVPGGPNVS